MEDPTSWKSTRSLRHGRWVCQLSTDPICVKQLRFPSGKLPSSFSATVTNQSQFILPQSNQCKTLFFALLRHSIPQLVVSVITQKQSSGSNEATTESTCRSLKFRRLSQNTTARHLLLFRIIKTLCFSWKPGKENLMRHAPPAG